MGIQRNSGRLKRYFRKINNIVIKQAIIVTHILLLGCSLINIELRMAVAKGVNAIMISVFATFVFWMDNTKAVLPNAIKTAYNKPGNPVISKAWRKFFL